MPARELSANYSEETMVTQLSEFEPRADTVSGERRKHLFEIILL